MRCQENMGKSPREGEPKIQVVEIDSNAGAYIERGINSTSTPLVAPGEVGGNTR